jgi:hypothetical protein
VRATTNVFVGVALGAAICVAAHAWADDHGAPPWSPAGYYEHEAIAESSGYQASRQHEGVFWTLNDSGNPAALYAVRADGELIGEIAVTGVENYDWEALAADRDGNLWIGEIGNNSRQREDLELYVVAEPNPYEDTEVEVTARYPYRYPAENVDAEGLFLAGGVPYIVSKEANRAVLYRFPELREGEQVVLETVGELPFARLVTGADISADITRLVVCSCEEFWVYEILRAATRTTGDASYDLRPFTRATPIALANAFGPEAVAFDGNDIVLSSESRNVYHIPEWWYERKLPFPPADLPAIDELAEAATPQHGTFAVESYRDAGADIPGAHLALSSQAEAAGGSISLPFGVPRADLYSIEVVLTRGPEYGAVTCTVDGEQIPGEYQAHADGVLPGGLAAFGPVSLDAGDHTVQVLVGADTKLGLGGMRAVSGATFARDYRVVGPFERDTWEHIDTPLAPESDLDGRFIGMGGAQIAWHDATANEAGLLDLNASIANLTQENAVGYALTYVHSDTDREAVALMGSDGQIAVWVNGEEIHRHNAFRGARPDDDAATCHLRKGWNEVLVKIGQDGGGWELYLRFTDPEGRLQYSRVPLP